MSRDELVTFINEQYGRLGRITPRMVKRWIEHGAIPHAHGHAMWSTYTDEHVAAIRQILEDRAHRRTLTDWADLRAYQTAEHR